jgi:hypothetical protein
LAITSADRFERLKAVPRTGGQRMLSPRLL